MRSREINNDWVDSNILFADIVKFSQRDELKQKEIYDYLWEVISGELAEFKKQSDYILKSTGDGILLIAFNPKIDILEISKRLQEKLKKKNKIYLRQGLNCGKVLPRLNGRDAIGDPINICQRIMDCGDANHILASSHFVVTQIGRRPPFQYFHDLGEVEVKHGAKLNIFNYFDKVYGNRDSPQKLFPWRVLWLDASGERIQAFRELRSRAKKSILVMGIGLTYFSADLSFLESLLERDLTVRLLMIDPDIVSKIFIKQELFDEYFNRRGYSEEVRSSLNRLIDFIQRRKKQAKKGKIFLKKYSYFIPMNVTIVDEKHKNGQMLIEFCLPFSEWRLSSFFSLSQHKEFFETISNRVEELWNKSEVIFL